MPQTNADASLMEDSDDLEYSSDEDDEEGDGGEEADDMDSDADNGLGEDEDFDFDGRMDDEGGFLMRPAIERFADPIA